MKRVFLYVRVSTEEQAVHGLSIESQTLALEEWAKANGHQVVDLYVDAGISARKPATKRPELQRLLLDAQAGKGELVVFTKLDRWFRNISEYYKVQEILEKCHVDWRTIQEDYDTSTAAGRLKINIMLSVAQDEADRTSERIKAVFETKRQKLEPLTGQMPYGYMIDGKQIVKDPKTERAVSIFFRSFLESGSIAASQRDVFEQCGINLTYQRVHKMMGCTAYYGRYFGADGMTPPYVTKEEFETMRGMRKKVVRKSPKNNVFLFSGLIICPECGHRMGTRRASASTYQYYTCPTRYVMGGKCQNRVCLGERKIERFLMDTVEEKIKQAKFEYESEQKTAKRTDYKAELSAVRGKLRRLKELYVNDLISLDDYKADYTALSARAEELSKAAQPTREPNFAVLDAVIGENWVDGYQELSPERKRKVWRTVLKEIRIYPDRHIEFNLNL